MITTTIIIMAMTMMTMIPPCDWHCKNRRPRRQRPLDSNNNPHKDMHRTRRITRWNWPCNFQRPNKNPRNNSNITNETCKPKWIALWNTPSKCPPRNNRHHPHPLEGIPIWKIIPVVALIWNTPWPGLRNNNIHLLLRPNDDCRPKKNWMPNWPYGWPRKDRVCLIKICWKIFIPTKRTTTTPRGANLPTVEPNTKRVVATWSQPMTTTTTKNH
mmetsp:Transcript_28292/g.59171  ORF Transcript_28292/g.59171 Transcript_28292/m.59171 type:complete len:214 (-) Transcript_28292:994-1635(-)